MILIAPTDLWLHSFGDIMVAVCIKYKKTCKKIFAAQISVYSNKKGVMYYEQSYHLS